MDTRTPSRSAKRLHIRTHNHRRLLSRRSSAELIFRRDATQENLSFLQPRCRHPSVVSSASEIPRARVPMCRGDYLRTCDNKTRPLWPNDRSRAAAWILPALAAPEQPELRQMRRPPALRESNFFYNLPRTVAG